jgi:TPP-dependent pyruvate/acetoin dehydrogenase alpha subunit
MLTKKDLIDFENGLIDSFHNAELPYPIHFSGGNEGELIEIFKNINEQDWIFTTYRNHYHYLLKGGDPSKLRDMVHEGRSMHICDKDLNFYSSAIVAGHTPLAAGTAYALKNKNSERKVWCFLGDGAEDSGTFYESVRYVDGYDLPCTFIIEDNDRSVETPKSERYGKSEINWPSCVQRYNYEATYPHVNTGKLVDFSGFKEGGNM